MAVTTVEVTFDQFLNLPEEEPALEYIDGRIVQKVSPKMHRSALQLEIGTRINQFALPRKAARAFTELRTTFAGQSRVPDVAIYRWDRIPRDANGRLATDALEPPDITIEIVSPGQSMTALVRRCLWYVGHGVQLALAVDAADESVLACHPDGRIDVWHGADQIDLGDLLPEFELTTEELFACLS